jgi:hypothetical protein
MTDTPQLHRSAPPQFEQDASVRHVPNLLNRGWTIADYGPQLQTEPEGPITKWALQCLLSLNEFYYFY